METMGDNNDLEAIKRREIAAQKEIADKAFLAQVTDSNSFLNSTFHPFFLHNNDNPSLVLTSRKLVGTENYSAWKRSMQIALSAKNKLDIVNNDYPKPLITSPLYPHWARVNDMIISWIMNTLSPEIGDSMSYVMEASLIWKELEDRFSSIDGHRIYQLLKEMHSLEQENKSVEIYFHKLKGYWDEFQALEPPVACTCEARYVIEERENRRRLLQFLLGLHESFTTSRGQILMMSPLPDVNHAYSLIKQDEKQKQGYSSIMNGTALFTGNHAFKQPKWSPNKQASFGNSHQSQTGGNANEGVKCSHCHGGNHTVDKCYYIIGFPPSHPKHPANRNKSRFSMNKGPNSYKRSNNSIVPSTANAAMESEVKEEKFSTTNVPTLFQMQQFKEQMEQMYHFMNPEKMKQERTMYSPEDHFSGLVLTSLAVSGKFSEK